ncbi:MurR/RpiR family transcriptional regulator [Catellatospora bangladeshensis]|uniref:MurR/RpiR family transcriptional regulator n=1 Tax=Catellatospora bangladeshensis TaxID=310355 RepID=UPI00361ADF38
MRMELPNLPDALQRVAEQILEDPALAAQASIVDLAERAGTSTATVTRFCRVLGFRGTRRCGWRSRPRAGARRRRAGRPTSTARSSRATRWTACSA